MTIFKKKATDIQETKKLPMTGKVKKGFRAYCTMVIIGALALGMTTTAFAANDPLTVVNNLSDFIFGLIRAIGMILLGFGIVQVGLSLKSHDPSQRAKRNNYVVNRIKPDNEQIYYIIDAINDAINAGKQISFQYYDYTGLKKKVLKNKGEVYKLSPYKLLWCGDYYYVLGYSEKKSKVINFRVDRIASKPEILDKDIIPMPDDFDIENYTKEVFFMFSGEKVLVDLRCDNSLMKTMVDRFGEDVTTLAYDMTSFRVQTEVSASPTFFGWVFGFNGKVQILAPENLKEQYRQMLTKATEDMKENE